MAGYEDDVIKKATWSDTISQVEKPHSKIYTRINISKIFSLGKRIWISSLIPSTQFHSTLTSPGAVMWFEGNSRRQSPGMIVAHGMLPFNFKITHFSRKKNNDWSETLTLNLPQLLSAPAFLRVINWPYNCYAGKSPEQSKSKCWREHLFGKGPELDFTKVQKTWILKCFWRLALEVRPFSKAGPPDVVLNSLMRIGPWFVLTPGCQRDRASQPLSRTSSWTWRRWGVQSLRCSEWNVW